MNMIVLCATQRCGSTLVVEDLRNTGILGMPEEWFIPWDPKAEKDWSMEWNALIQKGSTPNGVISVKVMANQLSKVNSCIKTYMPSESSATFSSIADAFLGATWIRIRRRNIVRQAISRVVAAQTRINHATKNVSDPHFAGNLLRGYTSNYNTICTYDFKNIHNSVCNIVVEEVIWDRFFEENHIIPSASFFYEDIHSDPAYSHIAKIAQIAGVKESFTAKERRMVQLSSDVNEDWYRRYFNDVLPRL